MKTYRKGADYERAVSRDYTRRGYIVVRAAGSHSPFDLVAVGPTEVVLIQCKRVKKVTKPVQDELERFRGLPVPPGCRKEYRVKVDLLPEAIVEC